MRAAGCASVRGGGRSRPVLPGIHPTRRSRCGRTKLRGPPPDRARCPQILINAVSLASFVYCVTLYPTGPMYHVVYRDRGSARRARIKRVFSNQLVLTSVPVAEESVDRRRIRLRVDPQGLPRRDPLLPDSPHPQSTPSWALPTLFHERASCSILPRARPPAIYINNRQPNGSLSNVT